jgi:hypothetical protein
MSGKPTSLPTQATDHWADQAASHFPGLDAALAAAAPAAAGDHFAPHADVTVPEGGVAGIEHSGEHLPTFVSDWLL